MKRIPILMLTLVFCFTFNLISTKASASSYDFRNLRWGMSKEEVIAREEGSLADDDERGWYI